MSANVYRDIAKAMQTLYAAPGFTYFTDTSTTSSCSAYTTTDPAGGACPVDNRSNIQNGPAVSNVVGDREPAIALARWKSATQLFDALIAPTLVGSGTSKLSISGQSSAGVVGKVTVAVGGTIGVFDGSHPSIIVNGTVNGLPVHWVLGTSNSVALPDNTSLVFGPGTLVAGDTITWLSLAMF